MQRVVLDMQNYVMSDAIRMALISQSDFLVIISEKPNDTAKKCYSFAATAVIMEVTYNSPWRFEDRLKIRNEIKEKIPECKVVLFVDENSEKELAEQIKQAKRDGLIDLFLYGSTSASFLTALIDTL